MSNINTDKVIQLQANVPIPDGDELNWPLNVLDFAASTVASVAVELDSLWHEEITDLQ